MICSDMILYNIRFRLRWYDLLLNPKSLINRMACPSILYSLGHWLGCRSSIFLFNCTEHLIFDPFWMCRYKVPSFIIIFYIYISIYNVTKILILWRDMRLCACYYCYLSQYTSMCLASDRTFHCSCATVSTHWMMNCTQYNYCIQGLLGRRVGHFRPIHKDLLLCSWEVPPCGIILTYNGSVCSILCPLFDTEQQKAKAVQ